MDNYLWLIVIGFGLLILKELTSIARSQASIATMMERLLSPSGVEPDTEAEPSVQVRTLALDPKTYVAAIKAYRAETGLGLKEAKAVVDRLSRAGNGAT